jgi:hypothetical protein
LFVESKFESRVCKNYQPITTHKKNSLSKGRFELLQIIISLIRKNIARLAFLMLKMPRSPSLGKSSPAERSAPSLRRATLASQEATIFIQNRYKPVFKLDLSLMFSIFFLNFRINSIEKASYCSE